MMRLKIRQRNGIPENVLPLVNVVFLLLIFFMLAGAFSRPDLFKVVVPTAQVERAADRKELTILMDENGRIAVEKSIIDDNELRDIVAGKVKNNEDLELQLKADANADATRLVELIEILNTTGLRSIRLLTVSPN